MKNSVVAVNNYREMVSGQYRTVCEKTGEFFREVVKFGALLNEVSDFIGARHGGDHENGSLQSWLAENCPEVEYKSAMSYKAMAAKCAKMIGGGTQALAVLQDKTLVQEPVTGDTIDVDGDFIRRRDELFTEVDSRRKLEQMWFQFCGAGMGGRPGRPKGSGAGAVEYKKKSALECAVEAVWPTVDHLLKHRGEMFTAYKILPDEKLIEMRQTLVEHVNAIEAVLKARG